MYVIFVIIEIFTPYIYFNNIWYAYVRVANLIWIEIEIRHVLGHL